MSMVPTAPAVINAIETPRRVDLRPAGDTRQGQGGPRRAAAKRSSAVTGAAGPAGDVQRRDGASALRAAPASAMTTPERRLGRGVRPEPPPRQIAGRTVTFDNEGFLWTADDWGEEVAAALAAESGPRGARRHAVARAALPARVLPRQRPRAAQPAARRWHRHAAARARGPVPRRHQAGRPAPGRPAQPQDLHVRARDRAARQRRLGASSISTTRRRRTPSRASASSAWSRPTRAWGVARTGRLRPLRRSRDVRRGRAPPARPLLRRAQPRAGRLRRQRDRRAQPRHPGHGARPATTSCRPGSSTTPCCVRSGTCASRPDRVRPRALRRPAGSSIPTTWSAPCGRRPGWSSSPTPRRCWAPCSRSPRSGGCAPSAACRCSSTPPRAPVTCRCASAPGG